MTYSAADHAAATAYAHLSNRDAKRDGGISAWLLSLNPVCFDCDAAPATEFAHFTRAKGRTVVVGDTLIPIGAMACRDCNLRHNAICEILDTDGTLPIEYLMAEGRADRIPTEYLTRTEYVAIHAADVADDAARIRDDAFSAIAACGL